jgi:hypothetical protein
LFLYLLFLRFKLAKQLALLESKKLALVLDLDHTLLHAVAIHALPTNPHMLEVLGVKTLTLLDLQPVPNAGRQTQGYFDFDPFNYSNSSSSGSNSGAAIARHHLIKLRPGLFDAVVTPGLDIYYSLYVLCMYAAGVAEFLEEMNSMFQLSIYTAGTRKYAEG